MKDKECCSNCNYKGVAHDSDKMTYFGGEYCGKPDCKCHQAQPEKCSIPFCECDKDHSGEPMLAQPVSEWEKEFEDRFGGGDESGDYPSNAIKAFISNLLTQERAKIKEKVLDEVREVANKYSGTGEKEGEIYNEIRALEERLAELE